MNPNEVNRADTGITMLSAARASVPIILETRAPSAME